jgi:hypothetical protein
MNELSARRKAHYIHNTQQTQGTKIHHLNGIRTRNPIKRAAVDLRLRPHSHRDRTNDMIIATNKLGNLRSVAGIHEGVIISCIWPEGLKTTMESCQDIWYRDRSQQYH